MRAEPIGVYPLVGCSGWNYASWKGRFYPSDLPVHQWLPHYAQSFNTVEINKHILSPA